MLLFIPVSVIRRDSQVGFYRFRYERSMHCGVIWGSLLFNNIPKLLKIIYKKGALLQSRHNFSNFAGHDEGNFHKDCSSFRACLVRFGYHSSNFPILIEKPWLLPKGLKQINVLFGDGSVRTQYIDTLNNNMSCRQVVSIICDKNNVPAKWRTILLKNAEAEDSRSY